MEGEAASNKSKILADGDWLQIDDLPRPFDAVSGQLASLGALSVDDFLSNTSVTLAAYDTSFNVQNPQEPIDPEKEKEAETEKEKDAENDSKQDDELDDLKASPQKNPKSYVSHLRQASQNVFGSSECLTWEYLEESDPISKQCILTITRPSGATRSYKSDTGFTRRSDARGQAAQIAIDMGAIDFIVSGDSDALKAKKGLLLNPFNVEVDNLDAVEAVSTDPAPKWDLGEEPLKLIEDCCQEWRAGKVKPHWVAYNDPKNKKKQGAALRISLNAHVFRSYSIDPTHNTLKQAKIACARSALNDGVLDFIKYGNGQTEPAKSPEGEHEDAHDASRDTPPPSLKGVTLQEFYDTLPKPFPEEVGEASAAEINAPAWLNITLQSARGGRLVSKFTPVLDSIHRLHGSILRIERPEETRTYLVDPQFPKRSDAKSAVCLLAMSQGVGDYIRGLKEAAENKLPADKRKLANEKLLQVLASEYSKVRQGNRLIFTFTNERDAFGCSVKADVSSDPSTPDVREYLVKTEYRTKADAKAAVACHAAEQGLVDIMRFRGAPPPPDYVPFWEAQMNGDGDTYVPKRKEPERDLDGEGRDRKKRKRGNNGSDADDAPSKPAPPKYTLPFAPSLPPKPVSVMPPSTFSSKDRWKGPRATGSRGLGPTNDFAPASRSVGQDRSGSRSGGISHSPQAYYPSGTSSPPASRNPPPRMHTHVPYYDDQKDYRPGPGYQGAHGYDHTDSYRHAYPAYPSPPSQSHYHGSGYRSPPPPPPPPSVLPPPPPPPPPPLPTQPPPHHYPGYYGTPSAASPPVPHSPYAYSYQPHYPPQYPHAPPYPGTYSPHPPVMYSPPLPPAHAMSHSHPVHPTNDPYSYPPAGYHHPPYPPGSPPPPLSPPRYSHHVSYPSHPVDVGPYEPGRQAANNRRRHSTVADFRTRDGYPSLAANGNNQYDGKTPPPPVVPSTVPDDDRRVQKSNEQPRDESSLKHPPPSAHDSEPPLRSGEASTPLPTKLFNDAPNNAEAGPEQPSLRALYAFCAKEKISKPHFFHEVVPGSENAKKYKVWAEKDSQRLELPNQFSSVEEGYEKLSKRVLIWERCRLQQ